MLTNGWHQYSGNNIVQEEKAGTCVQFARQDSLLDHTAPHILLLAATGIWVGKTKYTSSLQMLTTDITDIGRTSPAVDFVPASFGSQGTSTNTQWQSWLMREQGLQLWRQELMRCGQWLQRKMARASHPNSTFGMLCLNGAQRPSLRERLTWAHEASMGLCGACSAPAQYYTWH